MANNYWELSEIIKRLDIYYLEAISNKVDSNKQLVYAETGLRVILNNFAEEDVRYVKIRKIQERTFNCYGCKYSLLEPYNYKYPSLKIEDRTLPNYQSEVCQQCFAKTEKLYNELNKIQGSYKKINIPTDIIKLKSILNKLTNKLRNYDASKH
jgi:hypothetical protein